MIPETLAQLSTVFRRRFLFNALLPTLVFATLLAVIIVDSFGSLNGTAAWWSRLDVVSKAVTVLLYAATMWFLAAAVASQWRGIVRLFEGYPARRLYGEGVPGIAWHRAQRSLLWDGEAGRDNSARPVDAYPLYPHVGEGDDVLPTRLGNILLAGERYPRSRYGMETIYYWPRLYPLLPEQFQIQYEEFTVNHEFPLVVAFQSFVVAVAGGTAIVVSGGSPWSFLFCFGGGSLVAYAFYILSLSSAVELAEQQRTAFDLYRHLLLDQWATPADVRDEKNAFRQITRFILFRLPPEWGLPQSRHRERHRPDPQQ